MRIEVPSRVFEAAFPRARRFLLWHRSEVARRRYVVAGLPLRDLLVMSEKIRALADELSNLSIAEACVVILGTTDALMLADTTAREIWHWWHEANCLPLPKPGARDRDEGTSSMVDLVFRLERWPFNFAPERVMRMSAAEAVARLEEFARTTVREREREAAVA